jgi:putative spermidine/putrescine transport system substrate-binding protein
MAYSWHHAAQERKVIGDRTHARHPADLLGRRTLLGRAAGLVGASALGLAAHAQGGRFAGRTLVYVSWGGFYQDSQKAAFCNPFAAETGARVVQDGPMNEARVRTMAAGGAPEWDVCDVTDTFLFNGAPRNLFERIDYSVVDRSQVLPAFVHEFGVGTCVWSYNLGYGLRSFPAGQGPRTWVDLFDTRRFPGKRSFRDRAYGMLEIALLADGVDPRNLYPLDLDRAFRKLDTIKDSITWWTTTSQSQQLLVDGAVTCGVIQNGRAFDAVNKGGQLAVGWEQNLQSADYLVVLRGSKNRETAMHLLNRSVQADAQARFASLTAFSPVNPAAFARIEPRAAAWLPTSEENRHLGVLADAAWWEPRLEEITRRWTRWKLS